MATGHADEKKNDETPEERFLRLAGSRTNKALKAIENLGNLKGTAYKHEKRAERFVQIKRALIDAINEAIPKEGTESEEKKGFVLK